MSNRFDRERSDFPQYVQSRVSTGPTPRTSTSYRYEYPSRAGKRNWYEIFGHPIPHDHTDLEDLLASSYKKALDAPAELRAEFDRAFNPNQEGALMADAPFIRPADLEARIQRLNIERARLENRLALIEQFGTDDWDNGTVISFDTKFNGAGRAYTYVTLKAGNKWYLTGLGSGTTLTWEQLVARLASAETIHVATEWTAFEDVE